ncbi:methyl-accepting chemotaxis protein [Brachyspira hyodysenteriae]|uniref:methyl-accepting chemotaxis protein n=1 Tax=Brachyspira hyodysenteriae TaxID=159 RepID=UPI0005CAEE87|nr:methyl-accepting chemotaxis protein [Brachyspira hyodysenteriae]MCZ9887830.1 methyl-accepting chemotaxis protein [Brachyspira hyodysenteriae]MCZ9926277.1 methyl-accepting chemotaxis protein [Brachyspira hyodysenteriae]MCZ9940291.1 methyl-accepting chemotaxis protein [Brachyspira hyodysenteriae]MDA0024938.1 methyl-accepting chemotaxis protein [Brachyspira hyodysenteriae]MDA0036113.1 methyl-accepting chemotaxis protein [Brachyspira hyodysenteriae]
MIFKMDDDVLKRRLKFYMPALFVFAGIVSVSIFSILLKTVYQLSSSLISYLYIFIFILIAVFCVSIYFDCLKLEKGKYVAIGKIYVIKAGIAVVLVAIFSYSLHIYLGKISIFEMLNIRLIMVIFLISVAMSIASTSFNILVRPLYKKTGKKEYHLPIAYNFIPISIATVIFIVTFVNGMHYRSEIVYDRQYDIIIKKGYANDFINSISDSLEKYVTVSDNITGYMNMIYRNNYTLDNYVDILSRYLSTRYTNDSNISSVSVYFGDLENVNIININTNEINKLSIDWKYDISDLVEIKTNLRPNIGVNYTTRLATETNALIDITSNAETFYIYNPIILNNRHVGFVSIEVRSSVYLDVLSNDMFKSQLNIFLTDDTYNIKASNNPSLIGNTQRDLDNTAIGLEIKKNQHNNYRNNITDVNVISVEDSNVLAIKYSLFNNLYIINIWQHKSAYQNQLFRNTIIRSSVAIYLGLLAFLLVILALILSLRKTLVFAKNVSESLSEGEGDLTIRLPVISNNESGELVHSFNKFLDKVRNIIVSVKNNAYTLTGNIQNMRASISISISDFNTIYKEFETELANSNKIAESSANAARVSFMQRTRFTAVNETVQLLLDNINDINDKMKQQSEAVAKTSSSVQQMMANIVTVSHGATKANDYAKILYTEAQDGSNIGESVVGSIQSIKEYSKQITNITQVIHNIAEQTNLLAMNAAIEAAHAGDHGRGFTVVADKIRKLAEDTGENSKIINEIIEETTQAIDHTVSLAFKSSESMGKILEGSNTLADLIATISGANDELDIGRREILMNISNLNNITEDVQELSLKQMQMSSAVSQNISSVDKLAEDVVNVVNTAETEMKELVHSIENVSNLSSTSSNNMETMDKRIKELQYIFLQLYKLVISFKTEKTEEDIEKEKKKLTAADKKRIKLQRKAEKEKIREEKRKLKELKKESAKVKK